MGCSREVGARKWVFRGASVRRGPQNEKEGTLPTWAKICFKKCVCVEQRCFTRMKINKGEKKMYEGLKKIKWRVGKAESMEVRLI